MKKIKKLFTLFITAFMLLSCAVPTFAADKYPDITKKGSVTVTVKETKTGKLVSGGKLTIYQIASVKLDNADYSFVYTEGFADSGIEMGDLSDTGLAAKYEKIVKDKKLTGTTVTVGKDGKAVFADLPLGLYLVRQTTAAKDHTVLNPFIITVPGKDDKDEYCVYDVDAAPKVGTVNKKATTPPGDNPPGNNPPGNNPPGKNPPGSKKPGNKLPKTGQLWWPVPILAAAGFLMILSGWKKRSDTQD